MAPFRGGRAAPPLERWENLLRAERSLPARLRALGQQPGAKTLEDRERGAARVAASLLGRISRALASPEPAVVLARNEIGRPQPGPLLDAEIDRALALLADVPFEELQERGWHLQPNNFCWPLNDVPFLRREPQLWAQPRTPTGIRWLVEDQIELVRRLATYKTELADVPDGAGRPGQFTWDNNSFGAMDAVAYYGLVRELKPKRVIEVGAGYSSLLLARALTANGGDADVLLVDPYPNMKLLGDLPAGWRLERKIVQKVPLPEFKALEAGDVLFYDGSHCVETGGDVNWMLFRVLPLLKRGVWIHFHDIFWPFEYSADWVLNEGLSWNEQYILQAFLMHNRAYRARLANAMLTVHESRVFEELFPEWPFGASVWIEKDPGWMKRVGQESGDGGAAGGADPING
jgi:Methyltransferase domain